MPENHKDRASPDLRHRNATAPAHKRDILELLDDRSRRVLDLIARRWDGLSSRRRGDD